MGNRLRSFIGILFDYYLSYRKVLSIICLNLRTEYETRNYVYITIEREQNPTYNNDGILKKLFDGHTSLELIDSRLGKFKSDYIEVEHVNWIGSAILFGNSIGLLMDGNPETLSQNQRQIVLNALAGDDLLKSGSYIAINKEYDNADMKLTSLDEQLVFKAITSNENGFELSFEQKESPYFYFNMFFEDNEQQGVSIDS